jgi:histidine triad (HIT) family protein
MDCIFCKIVNKQMPAKILYEDEDVVVFPDAYPAKPVHLLTIPKQHVGDFIEVSDPVLFSKLFSVTQRMVAREGLKDKGFRIVVNGGGAQLVSHLHIHLMGPIEKTAKL